MMRHFLSYSIQFSRFNFHNECHWKYSYPTMVKTITSFITRTIIIICIIIIIIRIPPDSIISTSAIGRILNVKIVLVSVQPLRRYLYLMAYLQIRNTCNLRSTKDGHAFWLDWGQSNTALSPALVPLMQDHPSKYLGQNCFPFSRYCCTNYHMFLNFILIF